MTQREYQAAYYNRHFPKRVSAVHQQLAHPLFRSFYDRLAGRALDAARPTDGGSTRVLEVGCGEGLLATAMHRVAATRGLQLSYTGADLSAAALELARPLVTGELLCGDATDMVACLAAATQDLVVVKNLLHHLDDPAALVRECVRVLAPGGRLVVVEACLGAPQFWVFTGLAPKREWYFFAGRARNLRALTDGGAHIVHTERFSWLPYELAFAVRFDVLRRALGTDRPATIERISALDDRLTRRLPALSSYIVWVCEAATATAASEDGIHTE